MRQALIHLVHLYRRLVPSHRRRCCLFKVTCSEYVLRAARQEGLLAGIKALVRRTRQCRPGYQIWPAAAGRGFTIRLANGAILDEAEASPVLLGPLREARAHLERDLNSTTESATARPNPTVQ